MKQILVQLVFHSIVVWHHAYVYVYTETADFSKTTDRRVLEMKDFRNRYATGWNLIFQLIYFYLAIIYDILSIVSIMGHFKRKVMALKGYIFTSIVFPWTLFVFVTFWCVYTIDRELILPEASEVVFPKWINHALHTNIFVFLCLEMYLVRQELPTFKSAFIGLSALTILYDIIFFYTFFECGRWIYGIFYIFQWHERILFMLITYLSAVAIMKAGMTVGMTLQDVKFDIRFKNKVK